MRDVFHDQLDSLFDDLATMAGLARVSVAEATKALLTGDVAVAEQVISDDATLDRLREGIEEQAFSLLSLQAPVAGDLRIVVAALRMVAELERMGDLSVHVAKIARLRVPDLAVPGPVRPLLERMAKVAETMTAQVQRIIAERDVSSAADLALIDDEMDQLRRATFSAMLNDDWPHGVEAAVDLALLGRYYERIADHAVSVANRVVFVVTGEHPVAVPR
ncbi:phosphate signaling complex protein PhoU [Nocardioides zeae]|uniref:Phosphate-specific transport system accessory protein PhoU n=1 Tax=Nocardioides imazamoxiresistens TaxID=3231893 RepID=A0ABU3PY34_9ACTN|nr:phosphate signaling complex protein PhoU [Nocardioides zeae]MDT9594157.1 phosphate signaling complex protein PhoU [Nocardioides zeae]